MTTLDTNMLIVLIDHHALFEYWLGHNLDELPNADVSH